LLNPNGNILLRKLIGDYVQRYLGTLMKFPSMLLIVLSIFSFTTTARAALVYSAPISTGDLASPGSFSATFGAKSGPGLLTFNLQGYNTLDGVSCCADTFTLSLNGTAIWQGEYNLGGSGDNNTDFITIGSNINITSSGYNNGGNIGAYIPLDLIQGLNTLVFSYSGTSQGLSDEGWGTSNTLVTDSSVAAVPEPATWAMLIVGMAIVGLAMRRLPSMRTSEVY
jgi:hypothetical protein